MVNKPIVSKSHDGKHELKFFESSHRYYLDGKPVKSVTRIGSAYPKGDALTDWKIEQGIRSVLKDIYVDKKLISEWDDEFYDKMVKEHKHAYTKIAKQAAALGTLVHDYMYYLDMGKEDEAKEILKQGRKRDDKKLFNNAIRSADQYRCDNTDELLLAEAIVGSSFYEIGGKFDLLVKRKEVGNGIKDYKTSKGIHIDQFQQCATYDLLSQDWLNIETSFWEIIHFDKNSGKLNIARMDEKGLWLNEKLIIEDCGIMGDQLKQAERNIWTAKYQGKYKDFWKKVR